MKNNYKLINLEKEQFIEYQKDLYDFCVLAEYETKNEHIKRNISVMYWKNRRQSFFYQIYKAQNFDTLSLMYDGNKIISASGLSKSDINNDVCIFMRRLYCLKEYRKGFTWQPGFVYQYNTAEEKYKAGLMLFNDYNKRLYERFKQRKRNREIIFRAIPELEPKNICFHQKQIKVFNTMQWAIIVYLDPSFFIGIL